MRKDTKAMRMLPCRTCFVLLLLALSGPALGTNPLPQATQQVSTATGPLQVQVTGTGALCVFLVHGGRHDHRSWERQSRALARRGLRTFA